MLGVSIVICCYNSSERITETLNHIAQQVVDPTLKWEVIIIDNNCTDNTIQVAKEVWNQYKECKANFKIVTESEPGLSFAREKGIEISQYELILFCDDDNWLAPNFVSLGFDMMNKNSNIGILGTFGIPVFESTPPEWFNQLNINHATGKQHSNAGDITKQKGAVYGAGMFIRKSVFSAMKSVGFKSLLTDRKGESLSSGGDTEYCLFARLLGFQIHYTDELTFMHFFPKNRLSWEYNMRIFNAGGKSYSKLLIYVFLFENENKNWYNWKLFLIKNFVLLFRKQFSSAKRLYFYFFKNREGEEYFLNYSFRFGLLNGLISIFFFSNYFRVKNINLNVNRK